MSKFIGESYEPDMIEKVLEAQMERYTGAWHDSETGETPVQLRAGIRRRDNLRALGLSYADACFFHGKDSEIAFEILTD